VSSLPFFYINPNSTSKAGLMPAQRGDFLIALSIK
jgi:hypothetical protein